MRPYRSTSTHPRRGPRPLRPLAAPAALALVLVASGCAGAPEPRAGASTAGAAGFPVEISPAMPTSTAP